MVEAISNGVLETDGNPIDLSHVYTDVSYAAAIPMEIP
jgi:hypothetical protein